jgi:hypothetical protein
MCETSCTHTRAMIIHLLYYQLDNINIICSILTRMLIEMKPDRSSDYRIYY